MIQSFESLLGCQTMPNIGDQHTATGAGQISNPFDEEKPHISEYTAQEIATLSSRLEKQLGPEYISSRQGPGGKPVYYLAAEKSIILANEVFGFNGWSSSIRQIQMDFVDVSGEKVSCGLHAIVRVTLRDGTYHEDVGYGHMENAKGKAQAFEKAKKEATTDALKRALRSFGNLLGNCVYDKDYLKRIRKVKAPPSKWDVDNLHRHSDFAPVKKEPDSEAGPRLETGVARPHEDEFGSDDFDEVDFAVPEGDAPESMDTTAILNPQQEKRRSSLPSTRVHPSPNNQNSHEPPPQLRSNGQPIQAPSVSRLPNPQINARTANPNTMNEPSHILAHSTSNPTNVHNSTTTPKPRPPPPQQQHSLLNQTEPPTSSSSAGLQDPPVGFYTARAAETLQNNPNIAAPSFNPHLESPSIRKTAGIDHTKTKPVNRDLVAPPTRPNVTAPGPHGSINAGGGNTGFQPPGARKLGMPSAGMASPLQNRGSYKPPQMVKRTATDGGGRPALGDVTNAGVVNQTGDGTDAKRLRIGGHGSENVPGGVGSR